MLRVYFDMCALKRPWDDQSQSRVGIETASMVRLLSLAADGQIVPLRSPAHDLENARNSDPARAAAVQQWLDMIDLPAAGMASVGRRAGELLRPVEGAFDALHLAWAEALRADAFITTDDRLIRRAARLSLSVRVLPPPILILEIEP